jgi:heme exporter protein C
MSEKRLRFSGYLGWIMFVAVLVALYMTFLYAPTEREMGDVQRIFYFHVGAAWNGLLAFAVVFVASILYLNRRERKWDMIAQASAEIGVVFTTIVLVTGPIWARPIWGHWWTWDPRLTTTLVLWFIYVAYLVLRSAAEGEKQAKFAAIFGIVGFVDVPIVWMSIRWWNSIHPKVISTGGMAMTPQMGQTMGMAVFAFTILYVYLLLHRLSIEEMAEEISLLKDRLKARY